MAVSDTMAGAQMREYEGDAARIPAVHPCPKGVGQVEDADRAIGMKTIVWQGTWLVLVVATKALFFTTDADFA
jgi:hypothetical protein